jgi:hypothetical protein
MGGTVADEVRRTGEELPLAGVLEPGPHAMRIFVILIDGHHGPLAIGREDGIGVTSVCPATSRISLETRKIRCATSTGRTHSREITWLAKYYERCPRIS